MWGVIGALAGFFLTGTMCKGTTTSGTHWQNIGGTAAGDTWMNLTTHAQITLPPGQSPPEDSSSLMCGEIGGNHDMFHYPTYGQAIGAVAGFILGSALGGGK